jgi:hypothetical protein
MARDDADKTVFTPRYGSDVRVVTPGSSTTVSTNAVSTNAGVRSMSNVFIPMNVS